MRRLSYTVHLFQELPPAMLTVELTGGSGHRNGGKPLAGTVDVERAVEVSVSELTSLLQEWCQL